MMPVNMILLILGLTKFEFNLCMPKYGLKDGNSSVTREIKEINQDPNVKDENKNKLSEELLFLEKDSPRIMNEDGTLIILYMERIMDNIFAVIEKDSDINTKNWPKYVRNLFEHYESDSKMFYRNISDYCKKGPKSGLKQILSCLSRKIKVFSNCLEHKIVFASFAKALQEWESGIKIDNKLLYNFSLDRDLKILNSEQKRFGANWPDLKKDNKKDKFRKSDGGLHIKELSRKETKPASKETNGSEYSRKNKNRRDEEYSPKNIEKLPYDKKNEIIDSERKMNHKSKNNQITDIQQFCNNADEEEKRKKVFHKAKKSEKNEHSAKALHNSKIYIPRDDKNIAEKEKLKNISANQSEELIQDSTNETHLNKTTDSQKNINHSGKVVSKYEKCSNFCGPKLKLREKLRKEDTVLPKNLIENSRKVDRRSQKTDEGSKKKFNNGITQAFLVSNTKKVHKEEVNEKREKVSKDSKENRSCGNKIKKIFRNVKKNTSKIGVETISEEVAKDLKKFNAKYRFSDIISGHGERNHVKAMSKKEISCRNNTNSNKELPEPKSYKIIIPQSIDKDSRKKKECFESEKIKTEIEENTLVTSRRENELKKPIQISNSGLKNSNLMNEKLDLPKIEKLKNFEEETIEHHWNGNSNASKKDGINPIESSSVSKNESPLPLKKKIASFFSSKEDKNVSEPEFAKTKNKSKRTEKSGQLDTRKSIHIASTPNYNGLNPLIETPHQEIEEPNDRRKKINFSADTSEDTIKINTEIFDGNLNNRYESENKKALKSGFQIGKLHLNSASGKTMVKQKSTQSRVKKTSGRTSIQKRISTPPPKTNHSSTTGNSSNLRNKRVPERELNQADIEENEESDLLPENHEDAEKSEKIPQEYGHERESKENINQKKTYRRKAGAEIISASGHKQQSEKIPQEYGHEIESKENINQKKTYRRKAGAEIISARGHKQQSENKEPKHGRKRESEPENDSEPNFESEESEHRGHNNNEESAKEFEPNTPELNPPSPVLDNCSDPEDVGCGFGNMLPNVVHNVFNIGPTSSNEKGRKKVSVKSRNKKNTKNVGKMPNTPLVSSRSNENEINRHLDSFKGNDNISAMPNLDPIPLWVQMNSPDFSTSNNHERYNRKMTQLNEDEVETENDEDGRPENPKNSKRRGFRN